MGSEMCIRDSAGLGTGLGAVARAMDELTIESNPTGTVIIARKWLRG